MPRHQRFKYGEWANVMYARFLRDMPTTIAVDTETSGFGFYDEAFCVTVTWRSPDGTLVSSYFDLDEDDAGARAEQVRQILTTAKTWVFHNAKFDLQKLELANCLPHNWEREKSIEDTATLYSLIDENDRKGLKYLAKKFLHEETNEDEVLKAVRRKLKIKKDEGYHLIPRRYVTGYAMKDTEYTLRLWEVLWPTLPEDCHDLYRDEIDTVLCLLRIEDRGIGVDVPYLKRTASEYGVKLMRLDSQLQELGTDQSVSPGERKPFNPNSPKQILEAFARRGVSLDSTDKATLAKVNDPLAATLLEHRKVKKMHATYLTALLKEQRDGVMHPSFNTTLPRTGRMSSGGASNH